MKRYGQIIKIKKDKIDEYKKLHANPPPAVCEMIKKCHIQNYSIFLFDEFLFAYFEYTGSDFESDMAQMACDVETKKWWKLTDPCQITFRQISSNENLPNKTSSENILLNQNTEENKRPQWTNMQEIFYLN